MNANDINDLNNMFNNLGLDTANNVAIVPEIDENAFLDALNQSLQKLSMNEQMNGVMKGGRKKK